MRWLHISDIHFNPSMQNFDTFMLTKELLNYLRRLERVDYVFASGDYRFAKEDKSPENTAKKSADFLIEIAEAIGVTEREKILMVPGNHDINRDYKFRHDYIGPLRKRHSDENRDIFNPDELCTMRDAYDFYRLMLLNIYGKSEGRKRFEQLKSNPHSLISCRDVNVLCLNTPLLAYDSEGDSGRLLVGIKHVSDCIENAIIKDSSSKPIIVLGHHSILEFEREERKKLQQLFQRYNIKAYFCGHSHSLWNERIGDVEYITVGCLKSENRGIEIAFSVGEVVDSVASVEAHTWEHGKWAMSLHFGKITIDMRQKYIDSQKIRSCADMSNHFFIGGMRLGYLPLISSFKPDVNEFRYADVKVEFENKKYTIPQEFADHVENATLPNRDKLLEAVEFPKKVRINNYWRSPVPGKTELTLFCSPIVYRDYLCTNDLLDERIYPLSKQTFRDKYFNDSVPPLQSKLSNICGVGVFVYTSDKKVLIRKSSKNVAVCAGLYSFTASGTMDWNEQLHPFDEICRECKEEIDHDLDIENLYLFSFGVDYQKAYFQLCFYEKSNLSSETILKRAPHAKDYDIEFEELIPVGFNMEEIVDFVERGNWEQPAAAALLTLLAKGYSVEALSRYIDPTRKLQDYRLGMQREWGKRAERDGLSRVMSNRYPSDLEAISNAYIKEAMYFIDEDLSDMTVVEMGCGIGRMTKPLANRSKKVLAVDLVPKMIEKCKEYVGEELSKKVDYFVQFFQDVRFTQKYDVLVCSLVLIHNVDDSALDKIITHMKRAADVIYLFEQVIDGQSTSPYTKQWTMEEYTRFFPEYSVEKTSEYNLCGDKIAFIKLTAQ